MGRYGSVTSVPLGSDAITYQNRKYLSIFETISAASIWRHGERAVLIFVDRGVSETRVNALMALRGIRGTEPTHLVFGSTAGSIACGAPALRR